MMKKQAVSNLLRCAAFLLLAAVFFCVVSVALERKTLSGPWNYMAKMNEFYALEENALDYVVLGSSHAYCTVNPLELWAENGMQGFTLATQQQPLRASYHYLVEAFKTQSPKVVVLEGFMGMTTEHAEGVLYDAIDPLRPSLNKLCMIGALTDADECAPYYLNLIKYHTRWKEVTVNEMASGFTNIQDTYKGFVPLNGSFTAAERIPDYSTVEAAAIPEENLDAMNDILALTREHGAELVLMIAPFETSAEKLAMFKAERVWAEENGVTMFDAALLAEKIGIDPAEDFYDAGHLDISGAAKVSRYLGTVLESLGVSPREKTGGQWETDYAAYVKTYGLQK